MKLDFNIQVSQKQGLALTAQVQQAIKLLHMTNLEIQEFVEDKFQDNPFIEAENFLSSDKAKIGESARKTPLDKSLENSPYEKRDSETKTSLENQFETGEEFKPRSTVQKNIQSFDPTSIIQAEEISLYSHCLKYIDSCNLLPSSRLIAIRLLEDLEPTGWINDNIYSISQDFKCTVMEVEQVLKTLQAIEPAGLFARSLKECLILQAEDTETLTPKLQLLLDNLHLISSGKFDLLKRRCGSSDGELSDLFKVIKSFDPKPGLQFTFDTSPIREPDLIVSEQDNEWVVELNNSTLPSVFVKKNYASDIRNKLTEIEEKEFVKEKIAEAKWLTKAIQKRNETMIKVGTEIVKRQQLFLSKGLQYIQPLVLRDIAEAVGMHESTISRVTTGSLIQTPQGTLELKSFFSVGIQQDNGDGVASARSLKYKIKKLIDNEDPSNPISDDTIVAELSKNGVALARRTVAKYRKMENIPSSFARKRRNVLSGIN